MGCTVSHLNHQACTSFVLSVDSSSSVVKLKGKHVAGDKRLEKQSQRLQSNDCHWKKESDSIRTLSSSSKTSFGSCSKVSVSLGLNGKSHFRGNKENQQHPSAIYPCCRKQKIAYAEDYEKQKIAQLQEMNASTMMRKMKNIICGSMQHSSRKLMTNSKTSIEIQKTYCSYPADIANLSIAESSHEMVIDSDGKSLVSEKSNTSSNCIDKATSLYSNNSQVTSQSELSKSKLGQDNDKHSIFSSYQSNVTVSSKGTIPSGTTRTLSSENTSSISTVIYCVDPNYNSSCSKSENENPNGINHGLMIKEISVSDLWQYDMSEKHLPDVLDAPLLHADEIAVAVHQGFFNDFGDDFDDDLNFADSI